MNYEERKVFIGGGGVSPSRSGVVEAPKPATEEELQLLVGRPMTDGELKFFIGGEWVSPSSSAVVELPNPATEEIIGRAAGPAPADAVRAIEAARRPLHAG